MDEGNQISTDIPISIDNQISIPPEIPPDVSSKGPRPSKWTSEEETILLQLKEANPFQPRESFEQEAQQLLPNRSANAIRIKIQRLKKAGHEPSPPLRPENNYDFDLSSLGESELSDGGGAHQEANGDQEERSNDMGHRFTKPTWSVAPNESLKRTRDTAHESQGKRRRSAAQTTTIKRPGPRRTVRASLQSVTSTATPTPNITTDSTSNVKPNYDTLLEHIGLSDWVQLLNDARDCKVYKARVETDRRDTITLIDTLRKKELEIERLKDSHQLPHQSGQPLSGINEGLQAAWGKMMDILPKNVPSFNWESEVMKETVAEMQGELERLNKAAEGHEAAKIQPNPNDYDTSFADPGISRESNPLF